MRLRQRPGGVPREAPPDPHIELSQRARLEAARLYVIMPDRAPGAVEAIAEAAIRGGADILQLRHKTLPRGQLLSLARRLRDLTRATRVLLVVNDHVDIALLSEADGVHLGPDDISIESARRVAGDELLIGSSAWTPQAAVEAVAAGADYLGCGPAFATPIKSQKPVIGPAGVASVAAAVSVPVFAIGGIDESNVGELTALGLRRACVIRAVADAANPEAAVRGLRAMLDSR